MTKTEKTAYRRAEVVRDYLSSGLTLEGYRTARPNPPSLATLSRWVAAYRQHGLDGLRPRYHRGGGAGVSLTERQKGLLQLYWLHGNRPGVKHCLRQIETEKGEDIPYSTALRYVKSLPKGLVVMKRQGAAAYAAQVEPYLRRDYTLLEPMEMVCADHHTLDVMCVDAGDPKQRIFRPVLTAWIDMRSRKILSWTLRQGSPSQWTVMETLEDLVNAHGLPGAVLIDNGKDFVAGNLTGKKITATVWDQEYSTEVDGVFGQLGCTVIRATPYRGQAKPIERLFGFICADFAKQFDSYTGSDTASRSDEARLYHRSIGKQKKKALVLTLDQLRRSFADWASWFNSRWKHGGQGMNGRTPDAVFSERKTFIAAPDWLLDRVFCRIDQRTVSRDGVRFDNVDYYDPDIVAYYLGASVIARRPFRDTNKIYVYDLDGGYIGEMLACDDAGLRETGNTEADIAARNRAAKKTKKALENYEIALGEERVTTAARHRPPPELKKTVGGWEGDPPPPEKKSTIPLLLRGDK